MAGNDVRLVRNHMPRTSPFIIKLTPQEKQELDGRAAKYTLPYFQVVRAKMILLAAEGLSNDEIALRLNTRREVVSMWRQRFFRQRFRGLEELPRSGRPRAFPPSTGRAGQGLGL
jgi:hypothetical protein